MSVWLASRPEKIVPDQCAGALKPAITPITLVSGIPKPRVFKPLLPRNRDPKGIPPSHRAGVFLTGVRDNRHASEARDRQTAFMVDFNINLQTHFLSHRRHTSMRISQSIPRPLPITRKVYTPYPTVLVWCAYPPVCCGGHKPHAACVCWPVPCAVSPGTACRARWSSKHGWMPSCKAPEAALTGELRSVGPH